MSITVNAIAYADDTNRTPDSSRYVSATNSLTVKDYVDLKRVAPKPSSDSLGKGRSMIKCTRTATDGTDPVGDLIVSIDGAFPVGTAEAEIEAAITDACTFAISAAGLDVFTNQKITHA